MNYKKRYEALLQKQIEFLEEQLKLVRSDDIKLCWQSAGAINAQIGMLKDPNSAIHQSLDLRSMN